MTVVLDHVQDTNGIERHRLEQLYPVPEFVKSAAADSLVPQTGPWADPRRIGGKPPLYPCHTKAATFLSALFWAEKRADYEAVFRKRDADVVQERLEQFIDTWGLRSEVDAVRTKRAELIKGAADAELPDSAFALVYVDGDGHKHRTLRMKTAGEVKQAAAWLARQVDSPTLDESSRPLLSFTDRNVVAVKVMAKAAAFGADLGEHELTVQRQAGLGVCDPQAVVGMLRNRAKLAKTAAQQEGIAALAAAVEKNPRGALNLDKDMRVKMAALIADTIDPAIGLLGKYTPMLPRPEDVLFQVTYKEAGDIASNGCELVTGAIFDKRLFSKLSLDKIRGALGDEIAEAMTDGLALDIEKMADVAATLPRGDAQTLAQLFDEAGIPALRKDAGFHVIDNETLARLQSQY